MPTKILIAKRLTVRRGLDEREAAVYLSLSPSFFRRLVAHNRMPRPRVAGARRIWDINELDRAFLSLPRDAGTGKADIVDSDNGDSWSDYS